MTAKEWFEKAQAENFAIGAFNADNLDIFKAICVAAQRKKIAGDGGVFVWVSVVL